MRWIGIWLLRGLVGFVAIALLAIAVDWAVYVLRGSPQSSLVVSQFMSVPLKGQKTEYDYLGTANVACAVALFPHAGEPPCWYLKRHATQWDNLGSPQY